MRNSYQTPQEDIRAYARRLEKLAAKTKQIVLVNYDANQPGALNTEIDNI